MDSNPIFSGDPRDVPVRCTRFRNTQANCGMAGHGLNCGEGTGTARQRDVLRRVAAAASLCTLVCSLALVSNSAGKGAAEEKLVATPSFSLDLLQSLTPGFRVAGAGDTRAYPPRGKVPAHDYVETKLRIQQLPHNCTGQSYCACGFCLHTTCKTKAPPSCVPPSSPLNMVAPPLIPLSPPPPPPPLQKPAGTAVATTLHSRAAALSSKTSTNPAKTSL